MVALNHCGPLRHVDNPGLLTLYCDTRNIKLCHHRDHKLSVQAHERREGARERERCREAEISVNGLLLNIVKEAIVGRD